MIWIGADPGGKRKFGAAVLFADSSYDCKDVSSVPEFINFIESRLDLRGDGTLTLPSGVGIDAPLWWSKKEGGSRKADEWIRDQYEVGSSVLSINSLQGAVLVQGIILAKELRRVFPNIKITESHPKALLKAKYGKCKETASAGRFFEEHQIKIDSSRKISDHQTDALIAAICARETFQLRWDRDLARDPGNAGEINAGIEDVHYGWPDAPPNKVESSSPGTH
jgi:predicted nuclease with RNAse H fold